METAPTTIFGFARALWLDSCSLISRTEANSSAKVQTSPWNHLEMVLPHRWFHPQKAQLFLYSALVLKRLAVNVPCEKMHEIVITHGRTCELSARPPTGDGFIERQCHSTVKIQRTSLPLPGGCFITHLVYSSLCPTCERSGCGKYTDLVNAAKLLTSGKGKQNTAECGMRLING